MVCLKPCKRNLREDSKTHVLWKPRLCEEEKKFTSTPHPHFIFALKRLGDQIWGKMAWGSWWGAGDTVRGACVSARSRLQSSTARGLADPGSQKWPATPPSRVYNIVSKFQSEQVIQLAKTTSSFLKSQVTLQEKHSKIQNSDQSGQNASSRSPNI